MWNERNERTNGGFLIKAYEPMLLHIISIASSSSEEDRAESQGVFSDAGVSVAATTTTLYPSSMPGIDRIEFECSIYPEHYSLYSVYRPESGRQSSQEGGISISSERKIVSTSIQNCID